jgi:hypothetical protein
MEKSGIGIVRRREPQEWSINRTEGATKYTVLLVVFLGFDGVEPLANHWMAVGACVFDLEPGAYD